MSQINLPGTLDSTFGVNGKVMTAFNSNTLQEQLLYSQMVKLCCRGK
ncbi:MAG: hypothetical protein R2847_08305 [Bacteroidia bacterium]